MMEVAKKELEKLIKIYERNYQTALDKIEQHKEEIRALSEIGKKEFEKFEQLKKVLEGLE